MTEDEELFDIPEFERAFTKNCVCLGVFSSWLLLPYVVSGSAVRELICLLSISKLVGCHSKNFVQLRVCIVRVAQGRTSSKDGGCFLRNKVNTARSNETQALEANARGDQSATAMWGFVVILSSTHFNLLALYRQ